MREIYFDNGETIYVEPFTMDIKNTLISTSEKLQYLKKILCTSNEKETLWDTFFDRHIVLSDEHLKDKNVYTTCKKL